MGRFDLLFEDEFQTKILMELKARPGKYEDATQLARYKDELQRRGQRSVLMWLVAPQIPTSVREFLDRIGIEYSEIHISEFRQVAERHDVPLGSDQDAVAGTNTGAPTATIRPGSWTNDREYDEVRPLRRS